MRLSSIEKRIQEIDGILADKEREKQMASGISMPFFKGMLKNANRPLIDERTRLETERRFILDRRESIFWRIIWNVIVPVFVSVMTMYTIFRLGLPV